MNLTISKTIVNYFDDFEKKNAFLIKLIDWTSMKLI